MANIHKCKLIVLVVIVGLITTSFISFSVIAGITKGIARVPLYFPQSCGNILNQIDCQANGCYWWDDACHQIPAWIDPVPGKVCVEVDSDLIVCQSSIGYSVIVR